MNPCTAPKAKGRPCVFTDGDRCLWCGRTAAVPPNPTHCVLCGNALCSRVELGRLVDAALDALNATQPATLLQRRANEAHLPAAELERTGAGIDVAALAGNLAVVGFELLRLSSMLRLCRNCSDRELQRAAASRLKQLRKVGPH